MLGLVIVHDEAGVDDAGDPAEQREQDTQEEAKDAARHQDGHGRKDDAKEVAQGFQLELAVSRCRPEVNLNAAWVR